MIWNFKSNNLFCLFYFLARIWNSSMIRKKGSAAFLTTGGGAIVIPINLSTQDKKIGFFYSITRNFVYKEWVILLN